MIFENTGYTMFSQKIKTVITIKDNHVSHKRYEILGDEKIELDKWDNTLQGMGWTSIKDYIKRLKNLGYVEVRDGKQV